MEIRSRPVNGMNEVKRSWIAKASVLNHVFVVYAGALLPFLFSKIPTLILEVFCLSD